MLDYQQDFRVLRRTASTSIVQALRPLLKAYFRSSSLSHN